jgi:hypothetical protein
MNLKNLSEIERETYDFIKDVGEIQTKNLPNRRMSGVLPRLKNEGLVEVYKRYTSNFRRKKKKFVKIRNKSSSED